MGEGRRAEWLNDLEVVGGTPTTEGRLYFVSRTVDTRISSLRMRRRDDLLLPWQQEVAFEVNISRGLEELLADDACRALLRHIVTHGERARVVVFVHEDIDRAALALTKYSGMLAAAMVEGRSLRHVSGRPPRGVVS